MSGSFSPAEYEMIKRMCANMNKEDLGFRISRCDCRILKIVIWIVDYRKFMKR